jgi:hypothetical protein
MAFRGATLSRSLQTPEAARPNNPMQKRATRENKTMTSRWMCTMARKLTLARSCGSPRERYSQDSRSKPRPDPPRAPSCREWIEFLSDWHRIVHVPGYRRRGTVPPAPPTIWEFCEGYDLPVPRWAILNAEIHGWHHVQPLIDRLTARHAHLASLSADARRQLYETESLMRRMERDRTFASNGWVQTGQGHWKWPARLLS